MNTPPRYRSFRFGIGGVDVVPGAGGISIVKTRQPLGTILRA
jgi:feruloyl-CoA synthase